MATRDYYLKRREDEDPVFLKVIKALPKDQMSYRPHERSPSAQELVWTITAELKASLDVVTDGKLEWKNVPPPPIEEMAEMFERWSGQLAEQVSKIDDAAWTKPAQLYFDGKLMMEKPVGEFLWYLLFDAIHHRGQLSAYLRPMGGKVPAIYGPSADEKGGMM